MEHTNAPASGDQTGGPDSAVGHLRSSWEHGKEAAQDVKRTATKSRSDLSGGVDCYVKSNPKPVTLGALGAGLVLGFLTGTLASGSRQRSASEAR